VTRIVRICLLLGVVAAALAFPIPSSQASFHHILISEVFAGTGENADVQYVELVAYSDDQNLVEGQKLRIFDSNRDLVDEFTFPANLPGTFADQDRILIGTAGVNVLFSVTPDLVMDAASIPQGGGKICFTGSGDCFFYGDYKTTIQESGGSPFARKSSAPLASSAFRRWNLDGSQDGTYSADDDLNDPSFEFVRGDASPTNSSGAEGTPTGGTVSFAVSEGFHPEDPIYFPFLINRAGTQSEPIGVTLKVLQAGGEAGEDFVLPDPNPDQVDFDSDITQRSLQLELLEDSVAEPLETVKLRLTNPQGGAILGARTVMRVYIQDDDPDTVPPVTLIRGPKHGGTYDRLGHMRGDATDVGHGVDVVSSAIRRNMKDGSCRWLNAGGAFVNAPCSKVKFFDEAAGASYLSARIPTTLPSSMGTNTKNYTAFARTTDYSGNVEPDFEVGRNKNTFEER
jgi:hypothetical protein